MEMSATGKIVKHIISQIFAWANEHGGEFPAAWPMTVSQRRAFCEFRNLLREDDEQLKEEDCTLIVGVPIDLFPDSVAIEEFERRYGGKFARIEA